MNINIEAIRERAKRGWIDDNDIVPMLEDRRDLLAEVDRLKATMGERIAGAMELIERYGGTDGAHHKTWVIDQVARVLLAEGYETWVKEICAGDDGPETYDWDEGIAP